MDLNINNVINISVSQPGQGIGRYNTSNLALFSNEIPENFGADTYRIYLSPIEVADDFGTDSITYKLANDIFSQQPNILANSGYLVVIPMLLSTQLITPSAIPDAGSVILTFAQGATDAINFGDTEAEIQTKVRAIAGLEKAVVTGSLATTISIELGGTFGPQALIVDSANSLVDGVTPVTLAITSAQAGESPEAAVVRTVGLVQYFGMMHTKVLSNSERASFASAIQSLLKMGFSVSRTAADVEVGGSLDLLRSGGFTHTRGLFHGVDNDLDALIMMASYAGRALSTNFTGNNTTQTMHLKDLSLVQPDPSMNQTLLNKCIAAGADTYISIQGVSKTFCSGKNDFFDNIYNLLWFVGALQVSGFNVLAQTATKIAQTEQGVDSLKSSYRRVCEQGLTNQFIAPGSWTSPNFFGNQADFIANIEQRGYYIYSQPIVQQSPEDREDRKAPLIQIAIKYAGAIHSSSVIVNINK